MRKSLRISISVLASFALIAMLTTPASSQDEQASPKPVSQLTLDNKSLSPSSDEVAHAVQDEATTVSVTAKTPTLVAFERSEAAAKKVDVSASPAQYNQDQCMCLLLLLLSMPHK